MFLIIMIILVAILTILVLIMVNYNKFNFTIVKIAEAENNIDVLLSKKMELLKRSRPIIKKELKIDDFLEDMELLSEDNNNHFEMNLKLKELHSELLKILDENEKLLKSDTLISIIEDINNIQEEIVGSIKFYNDNVVIFNQLVGAFPSNVVAFLWRYKRKEFHNNEKKEMYEILNEK